MPAKPATLVVQNAVPMRDLLPVWKSTPTTKPSVVVETEYAVASLIAFAGTDEATLITRDLLVRWRDSMKAAGPTNATWNNRLSLVRQVLGRTVHDGKLQSDPTDKLRLRKNAPLNPLAIGAPYPVWQAVVSIQR